MIAQDSTPKASILFSAVTMLIGIVCISTSAVGIFWLSKILPGLYSSVVDNGYSFLKSSMVFHALWLIFFLSLLVAGIKLVISAVSKRTTDLVPGLSLYFVGVSLVIIGLFYIVFQQATYAVIAIIVGIVCIYFEGAAEIT